MAPARDDRADATSLWSGWLACSPFSHSSSSSESSDQLSSESWLAEHGSKPLGRTTPSYISEGYVSTGHRKADTQEDSTRQQVVHEGFWKVDELCLEGDFAQSRIPLVDLTAGEVLACNGRCGRVCDTRHLSKLPDLLTASQAVRKPSCCRLCKQQQSQQQQPTQLTYTRTRRYCRFKASHEPRSSLLRTKFSAQHVKWED
eukprot:318022-Rhodomonas_salina.2